VPPAEGFAVDEAFYRWLPRHPRTRLAAKLVQHVPGMLAARRRTPDVAHYQWLAVQPVDVHLLPGRVPTVLTAHDVLPREPRAGQLRAQRRLYERVDAVVAHTEHGRGRLVDELGVDPAKVEVIPHGVLDALTRIEPRRPPELPEDPHGPVVLFFGLLRPYKGLDVFLDAPVDAERWVVGMPRMPLPERVPAHTTVVPRFVSEAEAAWCFTHADVVVLPYRAIEQSGVLFTALAFGKPVVISDVGGFGEVDAAVKVPPADPAALGEALQRVLADPAPHAEAVRHAAATTYAWGPIAERHEALYARIQRP
jgi:glycosyltransferase involved in cell wall biosynthesis